MKITIQYEPKHIDWKQVIENVDTYMFDGRWLRVEKGRTTEMYNLKDAESIVVDDTE